MPTHAQLLALEEEWTRNERNDIHTYQNELQAIFHALGHSTRLDIVLALWGGPAAPHQLADHAEIRRSTVSHHISQLEHVGLISQTSAGRTKQIELTPKARTVLDALLDAIKDA